MLNDSQKEQFQSLEQEAKHLFDKEKKARFGVSTKVTEMQAPNTFGSHSSKLP